MTRLIACGFFHPPHVIDNHFFEGLNIGADAAWIEERTGIRSRRCVLAPEQLARRRDFTSPLGAAELPEEARLDALAAAAHHNMVQRFGAVPQPDVLICGSSVPDAMIPAHSSRVAARLGYRCWNFDAHTACSSFVTNLRLADALCQGPEATVHLHNPERYTLALDYTDRSSCFLFGDGASVWVVSRDDSRPGFELVDIELEADPQGHALVEIPLGGWFVQDGRRVQKFAVSKTVEISERILSRHNLTAGDLAYFVGHQANYRMLTSVCARLGVGEAQHLHNVTEYGNQGAAGAPAVLAANWERYRPGDWVLISVVGSGLSWGGVLLRFCAGADRSEAAK